MNFFRTQSVSKIKTGLLAAVVFFLVGAALAVPALAAPGIAKVISYQGRLTDATGANVPDGTYNIKLAIYDSAAGGSCLYSAANTDANTATVDCGAPGALAVTVTGGLFNILLGDTSAGQNALPTTIYTDDTRYLGVTVNADTEMTPRRRLAVAYQALNALSLNSLATSAIGGANAFVPVTDASGNLTLTQTITAGTGVTVGNTTLAGGGISSAGSLNLAAGGGDNLVLTSGTDTVELGVGTNEISNTDAGANLVLSAEGDIKIKDGHDLILASMSADPATGVNGAEYYNTIDNKSRCFMAGAWTNCNGNNNGGWINNSGIESLTTSTDQVGIGTSTPVAGTKLEIAESDAVE